MNNVYGLIGYPLTHSFSKKYFSDKFEKEGITGSIYNLFEIPAIERLPEIIRNTSGLKGLNVTIPYKQDVIPFLTSLDSSAQKVGAVNVIKVRSNGDLIGFNSDYYGFYKSLENLLAGQKVQKALILGTGGAAKAVKAVLDDLQIQALFVSRNPGERSDCIAYEQVDQGLLNEYKLIINTTPLGTYPNIDACPELPYDLLDGTHYVHDLVYNPSTTLLMKKAEQQGSKVKNGYEMLVLQAEKSWEIWNE
ncbi:shikimate dehydrogenase [Rapidithrix thailandica]|uniref:Shikimate dehydrogenase n=1 Tax=Rapidithrix thailandica TaxID=413964 RepID=A0AAW9S703_9BACT